MAAEGRLDLYDGLDAAELARLTGAAAVHLFGSVQSTMDQAHQLAAVGAPAGTLVLADEQLAGRGRDGRHWSSPPRGIWLTLVERPGDPTAVQVLSLRLGLAAAGALDSFAPEPIRLKWPNDLYLEGGKLGGILVEARWRGAQPDWVAVGLGVNLARPSDQPRATALEPGTQRTSVLAALIPELRAAAAVPGALTPMELEEYAGRDMARGRRCSEPVRGRVVGVAATGELLVELADSVVRLRSGSLVLYPREGDA